MAMHHHAYSCMTLRFCFSEEPREDLMHAIVLEACDTKLALSAVNQLILDVQKIIVPLQKYFSRTADHFFKSFSAAMCF
jgi:hypothetical protein